MFRRLNWALSAQPHKGVEGFDVALSIFIINITISWQQRLLFDFLRPT